MTPRNKVFYFCSPNDDRDTLTFRNRMERFIFAPIYISGIIVKCLWIFCEFYYCFMKQMARWTVYVIIITTLFDQIYIGLFWFYFWVVIKKSLTQIFTAHPPFSTIYEQNFRHFLRLMLF